MTIVEFLNARINEDEAVALHVGVEDSVGGRASEMHPGYDTRYGELSGWVDVDPKRVLAECAAKRKVLELHGNTCNDPEPDHDCACSGPHGADWARVSDCQTLPALVSVYADHPDFDPGWIPDTPSTP